MILQKIKNTKRAFEIDQKLFLAEKLELSGFRRN